MAGVSECGVRSSPRLSQLQKMKAAKRAELAAVSKFSQPEPEDNREGKARAPTGQYRTVPYHTVLENLKKGHNVHIKNKNRTELVGTGTAG